MSWFTKISWQEYPPYFHERPDNSWQSNLFDGLKELFSVEYALGELRRRAYFNSRLQYNHRHQRHNSPLTILFYPLLHYYLNPLIPPPPCIFHFQLPCMNSICCADQDCCRERLISIHDHSLL